MENHIANDKFQSDMEYFTYFFNYYVPDHWDDDNHMEEFQGLLDIPYLSFLLFLFDLPPWPHIMIIIGWWCSKPRTEAIGILGSVPLLC